MEACCGESGLFVNHRLTEVRILRGPRGSEVGGESLVLGQGMSEVGDLLCIQEGSEMGQHWELGSLSCESGQNQV